MSSQSDNNQTTIRHGLMRIKAGAAEVAIASARRDSILNAEKQ